MEISVIVTVHNAEKYLRECLESVIKQTFADIEILCMDGGSTDLTPQILEEYAEKDKRIRIINDPNTSYGHKVNRGVQEARGKYISVLESDDSYREDMLEKLYAVMKQYSPDFVNADYLESYDVAGERYYSLVQMYRDEDYGYLQESGKRPENMRQIPRYWTGLFQKEFLLREDIRMNESPGAAFQDLSFRFLTSALAKTSYHLKEAVYFYRSDNPDSSVYDAKKAVITADEFAFLKGELQKREITDQYIWQHFYTWKYNDLYANMMRFRGEAREALYQRSYRELEADREVLEKNGYGENSRAISDFLHKSRMEIVEDIERGYQSIRQYSRARRALYERTAGSKVVIFGCGAWGRGVLRLLYSKEDKILCCTDNAEPLWGMELDGYRIVSPEQAVENYPDALFVVANKLHGEEIAAQLREMGVQNEMIFVYKTKQNIRSFSD